MRLRRGLNKLATELLRSFLVPRFLPLICASLAVSLAQVAVAAAPGSSTPGSGTVANSRRFLFLFETSPSMQRRLHAMTTAVEAILQSRCQGQLREGDLVGAWCFNEGITKALTFERYSSASADDFTARLTGFLNSQKFENRARWENVAPALQRLVREGAPVVFIVISSGETSMQGTPFDDSLNQSWSKWQADALKNRVPILTALTAVGGRYSSWKSTPAPWSLEFPPIADIADRPQAVQATNPAVNPTLGNAKPPAKPPLFASLSNPQTSNPQTNRTAAAPATVSSNNISAVPSNTVASTDVKEKSKPSEVPKPASESATAPKNADVPPTLLVRSEQPAMTETKTEIAKTVEPAKPSGPAPSARVASDTNAPAAAPLTNLIPAPAPLTNASVKTEPQEPHPVATSPPLEMAQAQAPQVPPVGASQTLPEQKPEPKRNTASVNTNAAVPNSAPPVEAKPTVTKPSEPEQEPLTDSGVPVRKGFWRENMLWLALLAVVGSAAVLCFMMYFRSRARVQLPGPLLPRELRAPRVPREAITGLPEAAVQKPLSPSTPAPARETKKPEPPPPSPAAPQQFPSESAPS